MSTTNRPREININQASYSIKMLEMIKEKTSGNLNKSETNTLKEALTQLKMLFVHISENN